MNFKINIHVMDLNIPAKTSNKEMYTKAALVGAVAAAGCYLVLGEDRSIDVLSVSMPAVVPIFLASAAGSIAGDLAHDYILPKLPSNDPSYLQVETIGVGIATSGIATWGVLNLLTGEADMMTSAGIGAASYIAGDYVWNQVLDKSSGGILF
jgi:hypothetical protein